MRTLKMLLLIVSITFSSIASADTNPVEDLKKTNSSNQLISQTVSKLLEDSYVQLNADTKATVKLAVNKDGEIVVLYVETNNEDVEAYIKNRLNYKKVSCDMANGKYFTVPVTMLKTK